MELECTVSYKQIQVVEVPLYRNIHIICQAASFCQLSFPRLFYFQLSAGCPIYLQVTWAGCLGKYLAWCLVVCCLGRCAGLAGWAVGAGWGVRAWCVLCGLPGGVLCLGYFLFLAFHFSLFFLPGFETDARFGGAWVGFWQGSLGFGSREVTF
ncbi:Hypothetical_protein [Hexamita inflata]|uniref:Hypothetical_protein n=1 Tax=Hexamita inflata TaxID=28002 RepID=A0AA86P241_9EUKA|nr:Hypothetical protein HINF_LOCUS16826 [Hexamita inflata]